MQTNNPINPEDSSLKKKCFISDQLTKDGLPNESLGNDHIGIEIISVLPKNLYKTVSALKNYGFNYLQCQGGYDEGLAKCL